MSFPEKNTLNEVKLIVEQIQSLLGRDFLVSKAIEFGFTKKKGKLDALDFVLINLLGLQEHGQECSLTELCSHAATLGISICNQSLNERYNSYAVSLCKWLFEQVLYMKIVQSCEMKLLESFNGIFIEDSTSFQVPAELSKMFKGCGGGATSAAIKINCKLDLKSTTVRLRIKHGTDSDQNGLTFGCPKNSLWLRDLGYYKIAELVNLQKQNACFISRLPICSNAYLNKKGKEKLDLEGMCSQLSDNECFEQKIHLGDKERFPCRIIVIKLPKKEVEKRIKKLITTKKAKGKKVTQRKIIFCAINIFITNLSKKEWNPKKIWKLYTMRWQIEILFKSWKSILKLGTTKKIKADRLLCQFYIQMIQITLTTKLFRYFKVRFWEKKQKEMSELKGFKVIKIWWTKLILSIDEKKEKMIEILFHIDGALKKLAIKQNSNNNASVFNMCYFDT